MLTTETIWHTFHDRLLRFIQAHVSDPMLADDILQTVFLTIHQRAGALREPSRLTSWLFQITRHAIADAYRQRPSVAFPLGIEDHLAAPADLPVDPYQHLVPCLRGIMACLAPRDREALQLADLDGMPQRVLAHHWGVSLSGAKSRVQRARARLKTQLVAYCHLKLNQRGLPTAFAPGCSDCAPVPASFGAVPRLWEEHSSRAPLQPRRSFLMETSTPSTPTTGGFRRPVMLPLAPVATSCCGTPATDGNTCCGEPVIQVTDATVSGTSSCCDATPDAGGTCCN